MKSINETIASAIVESIDSNEGKFSVEVEVDDNTIVEVSGCYEVNGYCEDDYFNGTGAWIMTYAMVSVESCEVFTYDEDGGEVESTITPDASAIERYVKEELVA